MSSTVPIAAAAPSASMSFCFPGLLLITVMACPFSTNSFVSGLLMLPNEPVTIIFIVSVFYIAKLCSIKKTDVVESTVVVVKNYVRFAGEVLLLPSMSFPGSECPDKIRTLMMLH
jgi:hypothetical protein